MAARLNVLLIALNETLLFTTSLSGRLANGTYSFPFVTKSQWISSERTTIRRSRQRRPSLSMSSSDQQLPVGFCGLQRINAFVSMPIWDSRSSQSMEYRPFSSFPRLSAVTVNVSLRSV